MLRNLMNVKLPLSAYIVSVASLSWDEEWFSNQNASQIPGIPQEFFGCRTLFPNSIAVSYLGGTWRSSIDIDALDSTTLK